MINDRNHLEISAKRRKMPAKNCLTHQDKYLEIKKKPVFSCHIIRIKSLQRDVLCRPQKCRHSKKKQRKLSGEISLRRDFGLFGVRLCSLLKLIIVVLSVCVDLSSSASLKKFNTVDMLQDRPMISAAFIAQQNAACDMTKLCIHDEMEVSTICGSDGRTYNSLCEIKRAACYGNPVVKKYDGPCPDKSKCKLERTFQQDLALRRNQSTVFIPECEPDGSYSTVQCHKNTGYCWCVTKLGQPLQGTAVQFKRPNCFPQGKVGRRASRRGAGTRRKECTSAADRSTFNNNLMKRFRTEFERDPKNARILGKWQKLQEAGRKPGGTAFSEYKTSLDREILKWRFEQLDVNHNGKVSRREIRGLKRMAKKIVQPKACARNFTTFCDFNRDRKIVLQEWIDCLGLDINQASFLTLRGMREGPEKEASGISESKDRNPMMNDPPANPLMAPTISVVGPDLEEISSAVGGYGNIDTASTLWSSGSKVSSSDFLLKETESTTSSPNEEATDCNSQRQKAIREQAANPSGNAYVPDCEGHGGLYAGVQCHKLTQFCWCSDQKTGKPITGTSSRYTRPNCDEIQFHLGEIKGCKESKREKFFARFYSTLESSMIASGHSAFSEDMSAKELAVRWKFRHLDLNKNNRLERKEWKSYRRDMKTWKGVKRCGRNFLRFCDRDKNKKITMDEWINCALKAEARPTIMRGKIGPPRGKNPFLGILDPNQ